MTTPGETKRRQPTSTPGGRRNSEKGFPSAPKPLHSAPAARGLLAAWERMLMIFKRIETSLTLAALAAGASILACSSDDTGGGSEATSASGSGAATGSGAGTGGGP